MQRILSFMLASVIGLAPFTVLITAQPSLAENNYFKDDAISNDLKKISSQVKQVETMLQVIKFFGCGHEVKPYISLLRDIRKFTGYYDGMTQSLVDGKFQKTLETIEKMLAVSRNLEMIIKQMQQQVEESQSKSICTKAFQEENKKVIPDLLEVISTLQAATFFGIGGIYETIGQSSRALEYFKKALEFSKDVKDVKDYSIITSILIGIGSSYKSIGKQNEALQALKQALSISRESKDRDNEIYAMREIGEVYRSIGKYREALQFYEQALAMASEIGNNNWKAYLLNNIGVTYYETKEPHKALQFFETSRTTSKQISFYWDKISVLSNLGLAYREINKPTEAIKNLEDSISIALRLRKGLLRVDRQDFLKANKEIYTALIDLLIKQKNDSRAYEWVNLASIAELADYTRLINARVVDNSDAQRAIDKWNKKNRQLELLRNDLQKSFSEQLSRQMRELEAEVNQDAEKISRSFPEVAELFETTPTDIDQLRASIPAGTTVIHPVLLTNVKNVQNTIALFVLTKDQLKVKKVSVDPAKFDALLTQTYNSLTDRFDTQYFNNLKKLYEELIRPVEAEIQATHPKKLSIIATGKLRYIPFEALYDGKNKQYLIQKYPVSYLTRLSSRSLKATSKLQPASIKKVLAFGNPVPNEPLALSGAETEVKNITQIFPGSEAFVNSKATLNTFKIQSPRFSLLHLATHGCFQKGGCPKLGLEENTLLFADKRFNISDAAKLGLQNVDLIALSACQTALQTNSNGEEIAGLGYLFERAGAKAVIASLWSAADKTTEVIMVQFYQNLKKGMNKDEALRQAKLSQIDRHPFYWSPFVLIGDGR